MRAFISPLGCCSDFPILQVGKVSIRGGASLVQGRSSWMPGQGFRPNAFQMEPKTKGGRRRAISIVKGITLRYTLSTCRAQERRQQSSFRAVTDPIRLAVSSHKAWASLSYQMLSERKAVCGKDTRVPTLLFPFVTLVRSLCCHKSPLRESRCLHFTGDGSSGGVLSPCMSMSNDGCCVQRYFHR